MLRFFDFFVITDDPYGNTDFLVRVIHSLPSKKHVREFMSRCYPGYKVFAVVRCATKK